MRGLRVVQARPAAPFEFCENGAKATAWEMTSHRCTPEFFAEHTVDGAAELERPRPGSRRVGLPSRCATMRRATNMFR